MGQGRIRYVPVLTLSSYEVFIFNYIGSGADCLGLSVGMRLKREN